MAAIERIIITRDKYGAEPHIHFSISDKEALRNAVDKQRPEGSRVEMFANLLTKMSGFSGLNLPPDWKNIFLSGETFTWEFIPGRSMER